jgi:kanamycin kinase
MTFADPDAAIPPVVTEIAGAREIVPIWGNELGAITFALLDDQSPCFVKWSPTASGIDLAEEEARLRWLAAFDVSVPGVVDAGRDAEATWLVTTAIPGENAVTDRWKADPITAVRVIGESLRTFHDALPVDHCPFTWSVDERLAEIRAAPPDRVERALRRDDFAHLSPAEVRAILAHPPEIDALVVCHGDTCAPNTIIDAGGCFSGHVDLGAMGVADRWADLAIATWSTTWNYGPGWEDPVLEAYGIEPDPERTFYYRLLWELGP